MPSSFPKPKKVFLYNVYTEDNEISKIDWSPVPQSPQSPRHAHCVEYLLADDVRNKVDKLMTATWNLKNIYLASHPKSKNQIWIEEIEAAMRFADELFPPEEKREWRK